MQQARGGEVSGVDSCSRRDRELIAFTRYCAARIERQLGRIGRWAVHVAPAEGSVTATITIRGTSYSGQVVAAGVDGPIAVWEAMCRLEQRLREARSVGAVRRVEPE